MSDRVTPDSREALQQLIQEMREASRKHLEDAVKLRRDGWAQDATYAAGQGDADAVWMKRLSALLADVLGSPTAKDQKDQEDTRVDHTQYPTKPLATASNVGAGSDPMRDANWKHRYEDAALAIVRDIKTEFLPTMDSNDGGEILHALTVLCDRVWADALGHRALEVAVLRADLWNVAGCVVAACESQQEHIAKVACMEGSPLVDMAREVVRRHNLSNDTTSAVGLNATADFAGSNAPRTVDGRTRDLNSTPLTASAEVVSPDKAARCTCPPPEFANQEHEPRCPLAEVVSPQKEERIWTDSGSRESDFAFARRLREESIEAHALLSVAHVDGVTDSRPLTLPERVRLAINRSAEVVSQPPQGWQPIASAPKDGTWMLLYSPYGVDVGRFEDDIQKFDPANATHWMSLPTPPASAEGSIPSPKESAK